MILRNLDQLTTNPSAFVLSTSLFLLGIILAITVHEFSHALVATNLGDDTAKRMGRLSLNPLVHLDLAGSLMIMLAGFGWGKPVPVNPLRLGRNTFRDMALVASAGPISNILTAAIASIPFKIGMLPWPTTLNPQFLDFPLGFVSAFLFIAISLNLLLAVFNLIPLAPLDGSKVLPGILPKNLAQSYQRLTPWGPGILMTIILFDIFLDVGILSKIIGPIVNLLSNLMVGMPIL